MSGSGLDAWQISLVVTALVVLAEAGVNALLKRDITIILHKRVRTGALGLLVVLTVIVFVIALGPSLADELSSVAAATTAFVALWLTYRSYQSSPKSSLTGTGEPDQPHSQPDQPEPEQRRGRHEKQEDDSKTSA
jgi:hypothetical protein